MDSKQPWNHTQQCDYCKAHDIPADFHYVTGQTGCRHFRGGKSSAKAGKRWPKLELATN
jgi:hypothetical protein